ncbi:hypothetical protein [Mycobacteroides abscessus]|uniref:hypothetical protein n=1 Tax=Mycobacteroides abscessus TaxID=36809 RepID=UPI0009C82294|nr:hypothetical protein [Mycobacteroides abscessus]SKN71697.1 Uncharacterised protein [Mycobacteroides abscessus subsp. bolletii]SKW68304.1 Uncharacterised protein [Mycobacteroides abscessus subsp. bolletii]
MVARYALRSERRRHDRGLCWVEVLVDGRFPGYRAGEIAREMDAELFEYIPIHLGREF